MTDYTFGRNEGDEVFREDARRLGYLRDDPRAPGNGRGLRAYYRDHGMIEPEVLERDIPEVELTGLNLDLPMRDGE